MKIEFVSKGEAASEARVAIAASWRSRAALSPWPPRRWIPAHGRRGAQRDDRRGPFQGQGRPDADRPPRPRRAIEGRIAC